MEDTITAYNVNQPGNLLKDHAAKKRRFHTFINPYDFNRYDEGIFDFGVDSPFFVILSTTALLNLCAFIVGILRYNMVAELFLAGFGMANCWPVYEGMFLRSDNGKMPERVKLRAFFAAGIALAGGCLVFSC
jgi:hypothetical protein